MGRRERFSTLTMDPDVSDLSFGVNSSSSLMRFSSLPPDSRRSSTFILNPLPTPIQRPSRHSLLPLESQPSSSFILNPSPLQSIQSSSFISNPSPLQRPSRRYSSLPPESIPSSSFITNPRSSTLSRIRVSSSSTSNQATNGPSEAYLEALQVILRKGSVSSSDSHTTNLHSVVHMSVSALLAKLNEDELGNKE